MRFEKIERKEFNNEKFKLLVSKFDNLESVIPEIDNTNVDTRYESFLRISDYLEKNIPIFEDILGVLKEIDEIDVSKGIRIIEMIEQRYNKVREILNLEMAGSFSKAELDALKERYTQSMRNLLDLSKSLNELAGVGNEQ